MAMSRKRRPRTGTTEELLDNIFMQPWYLTRKLAIRITKMLPRSHTHKMRMYFEDYGCLKCGKKKVMYGSNGFCARCKDKVMHQMLFTIRRHFQPSPLELIDRGTKEVRDAWSLLKEFRPASQRRAPVVNSARLGKSTRRRGAQRID